MRKRYVQYPNGNLVEVTEDFHAAPRAPTIMPDLPGYRSPSSGLWVEGRRQRREDFKRTRSRPWEGMEQEKKEAARQRAYAEADNERRLDQSVKEVFYQFPPSKRDILKRSGQ